MHVKLTRELRFGLHEPAPEGAAGSANGFAGSPVLADVAPFLTLRAQLSGQIDAATGMLVNIKQVDRVLRQLAVPEIRRGHYYEKLGAGLLVQRAFERLQREFLPHKLVSLRLGLSPYLAMTVQEKEPNVVRVSERFEFSAAHRLHSAALSDGENREIFGRCNNLNGHGHNYELEVTVAGAPDAGSATVIPILELQKIVKERVIDVFDHKHLNLDCPEFRELNPTVENIAKVLYGKLKPGFTGPVKLLCVKVWETPKTCAEYGE